MVVLQGYIAILQQTLLTTQNCTINSRSGLALLINLNLFKYLQTNIENIAVTEILCSLFFSQDLLQS